MSRKADQNGAGNTVTCLECDRKLHIGARVEVGDFITCPSCGSEFEVVNLKPTRIEWAYFDDDEYDDDDYDDEDDDDDDDYDDDDEDYDDEDYDDEDDD